MSKKDLRDAIIAVIKHCNDKDTLRAILEFAIRTAR
jgi:hypothetical protein